MKKIMMFSALVTLFFNCYSQEFMGIKADGSLNECVQKFLAKGFTKKEVKGNMAILKGTSGTDQVELYIVGTPKTNTVWKFAVYFPEESSWYSIKRKYENVKETLTTKYGEPTNDYHFFSSPYYEGDGYETTALSVEKCTYAAFWTLDKSSIELEMTKWKQICISYENSINVLIKKTETDEINNKTY